MILVDDALMLNSSRLGFGFALLLHGLLDYINYRVLVDSLPIILV